MTQPIEKILEEFSEKFTDEVIGQKIWNVIYNGEEPIQTSPETVKSFLKQSLEKVYAEREKDLVERIEGMNNFRQAKVDGKDDWNDALEQSARKVDALLQAIKGK